MALRKIYIFTDGSAVRPLHLKSGPRRQTIGGWGAWIAYPHRAIVLRGQEEDTDSNRMEILAAIEAFTAIPQNSDVRLTTDSRLVEEAIKFRIFQYEESRWIKRPGEPVKNADLLKRLGKAITGHQIKVKRVRSRSGPPEHREVHRIARDAAIELQHEVEDRRRRGAANLSASSGRPEDESST